MNLAKTKLLSNDQIANIRYSDQSSRKLAELYGVSKTTICKIKLGEITEGLEYELYEEDEPTPEIIKLSKQKQRLQDDLRVSRKVSREAFRTVNVLEELNDQLIEVLHNHAFTKSLTIKHKEVSGTPIGVIQLSDLHFGEQVYEVNGNLFDLKVASKRLQKLAHRAKTIFKAQGITSVVIALTGDIINSDRRLDELTTNAGPRSKIIFNCVDVLQQFIRYINEDFNVSVASVTGNESRLAKEVGWVDFMANENFDFTVHNILSYIFKESEGVKFIDMTDPLECVIELNGMNLLLIHGHNGTANTARIENEVSKIKAKYSTHGVTIHYTIMGHVHSAMISDNFARSSGLPGGNAYSDKALNFMSKASQNIYIFHPDGETIDGMKVCLQNFQGYDGFDFKEELDVYVRDNKPRTVTIQSVLV